jgi:hypothetical protein
MNSAGSRNELFPGKGTASPRPASDGEAVRPRSGSPRVTVLMVQSTFEPSRIAAACLVTAYDQVVPRRHRMLTQPRIEAEGDVVRPHQRTEGSR